MVLLEGFRSLRKVCLDCCKAPQPLRHLVVELRKVGVKQARFARRCLLAQRTHEAIEHGQEERIALRQLWAR